MNSLFPIRLQVIKKVSHIPKMGMRDFLLLTVHFSLVTFYFSLSLLTSFIFLPHPVTTPTPAHPAPAQRPLHRAQ